MGGDEITQSVYQYPDVHLLRFLFENISKFQANIIIVINVSTDIDRVFSLVESVR